MKRIILLFLILTISLGACNETNKNEVVMDSNNDFDSFKDEFLNALWKSSPSWASWAGLHAYDSLLNVNSAENRQQALATSNALLSKLHAYELNNLDDLNKIDYHLIENFIQNEQWYLTAFKSFEWDPSEYNVAGRVWTIMNGTHADLDARLEVLSSLLEKVPPYYTAAINNLKNPTIEHLNLGLEQNRGGLEMLGTALMDSISFSTLSDSKKEVLRAGVAKSKEAIHAYIGALEDLKEHEASTSFRSSRIGKELFDKKYELEINANYTAEEIYQKALEEKAALHAQMIVITDTLWDTYFLNVAKPSNKIMMVKTLIDKIAEKHVSRENFFEEINRQIPILAAFVKEHDLLTQDPSKPLVVRETPLYMRGVSGASVSSPGPYEKGKDTYYNVTPLDNYTDEEAESYLREYNHYILQILNIHEGIPGHYTQLIYGNKSPSIIKSILANGAMIEGWANYAEIMMLEEGYNNSPEMWLMRNKWHLRGVTNTILDYSYHVLDLEKEEAMRLMTIDAFQEPTEAEGKWRRLTLSSVQLSSYFTGFSQIYELREELKALRGDAFNLKEFHEQFLSYGNAPVKYIREYMLPKSAE